jgi:GGDEF domain-containing protein
MASIRDRNEKAKANDEVVIACGMARFDRKESKKVEEVFERADKAMYENKKFLKGMVM